MAESSKLVFTMGTSNGDKTFSYSYVKSTVTATQVKNAGNAIVTNGSFFVDVPSSLKAAKLVTTTETPYDVSE